MSFNVGLNIVEVDGRATPSIQPAATSIAGFIIRARRGVLDGSVVQITSWVQFVQYFGGYAAFSAGSYAIAGFFQNGGSTAYVTRVAAGSPEAASIDLNDATDAPALSLEAGYRGQTDPGTWGNGLEVQVRANPDNSAQFDLTIRLDGRDVETFEGLTSGTATEALNNELTGSKFVQVTSVGSTNPAPTVNEGPPVTPIFVALSGGTDGTVPSATDYAGAVARFETQPIQLLACPETHETAFASTAIAHCANMGDRMFIGHTELNLDRPGAREFGRGLQGDKVYGALYWPWIRVLDPIGTAPRWVPPTGHIMGVYARTDRERGVWKAPAGDAARLRGALDVRFHMTDVDHTDLVKRGGVNGVRFLPGKGIIVDASRTLSTNPLWLYVNVRLLFNFVKSSLKDGLRWVVQEPNDDTLWNKAKFNSIVPFLMGLWRQRAFGPGSPEEVFTVKIDGENNTPEDIQQGRLNIEVYFYPSRPAETIIIRVGQQQGGASAGEG